MKRLFLIALAIAFFLFSIKTDARMGTVSMSDFNPQVLKIKEDDFLGKTAPDISFLTEKGETLTLSRLAAKPLILLLVYYECPTVCTMLGDGLGAALKGIGDLKAGRDFNVLVLSFNEKDSPEDAAGYHQKLFDRSNLPDMNQWIFATATEESIRSLTDAVGYRFFYVTEDQTFVHSAAYVFLSPQRKITRYLFGVRPDSFDARLAILESMEGRVGKVPLSTLVTYACYRYDPGARGYVANLPVLLGFIGLTMLILTALISLVVHHKRKALR